MARVVVITPPSASPVTLALAKSQCGVASDNTDDDDLITLLINTATQWIDGPAGWLGRSLNPQTLCLRQRLFTASGRYPWEVYAGDQMPFGRAHESWSPRIKLPYGPVQSVTSVTYIDVNGDQQTVDPSLYVLDGSFIAPAYDQVWPEVRGDVEGVQIEYVAGYPLTGGSIPLPTVPSPICHAILLLVSHFYNHRDAVVGVENRDSSTEMPLGIESLLSTYRVLD